LRRPDEERTAEFDFEVGDLLAQGRLRDVQLRAGLGEVAIVDDAKNIAPCPRAANLLSARPSRKTPWENARLARPGNPFMTTNCNPGAGPRA
jgi:hypothetical protein